jgi:hypothetical protein
MEKYYPNNASTDQASKIYVKNIDEGLGQFGYTQSNMVNAFKAGSDFTYKTFINFIKNYKGEIDSEIGLMLHNKFNALKK